MTQTHTRGRIPLGDGSTRYRDLYLKTHKTEVRATGGIRTSDSSKREAADRAATGIGAQNSKKQCGDSEHSAPY